MAYINIGLDAPYDGKYMVHKVLFPTSGMQTSEKDEFVSDGKCEYLCNMDVSYDSIYSRSGISAEAVFSAVGDVHAVTKELFCDRVVIHKGKSLYVYNPEDKEISLITDTLPDKKSVFCTFLSKLYIYCDTRVYSLDSTLCFTEEEPEAALLYDEVSSTISNSKKPPEGAFYNLVSPRIRINFAETTLTSFNLPAGADTDRGVVVYNYDEEVAEGDYTIYENRVIVKGDKLKKVSVLYYAKDPEVIGFKPFIDDCNVTASFGGNAGGGTRIFFTGNESDKGAYYKSALQNPLYVSSGEKEYIGDGCENITAAKKMYGNLIIFTEKSVFKMVYTFTSGEVYFSVKELSCGVGCDCPNSVQLINNRVVFLNSKKGIFIVSATDEAGEHNIKPISGSIIKGKGRGLLDTGEDALKNSFSLDFDRKYILFAGGKAFIWDYDKSSFIDSDNYKKSEGRLVWFTYDNLSGDFFYEYGKRLISFDGTSGTFYKYDDEGEGDFTRTYESGKMDFGNAHRKKRIYSVVLILGSESEKEIEFRLFADGESVDFVKISGMCVGKRRIHIAPKSKAAFGHGFSLSSEGAFEFYGAEITYKVI